jgi:selenide, water dikinase
LGRIPQYRNPDVLVGYETADDAGVFRLHDDEALVQTVDFFTPVVDDPYTYGAIAAANSLSDVYAMGGRPLTAMTVACFPDKGGDLDILAAIMTGGADKLHEAGVALVGGHTVADQEIKFGYSITGLVHPSRIVRNSSARPGDILVLTKPLGIGILTSGIKFGRTSPDAAALVVRTMLSLNRTASEIMVQHGCEAATDITGNGLLGHAYEMACGSNVTLRFDSARIPHLLQAYELAAEGLWPRAVETTWKMIEGSTRIAPSVAEPLETILLDPQTSGGLLIAIPPPRLDGVIADLRHNGIPAAIIAQVEEFSDVRLVVD